MDLLGQARPFAFLGLDDAHLEVRRQAGPGHLGQQTRVAALEEEPGVLHAPDRKLELGQLLLVPAEIAGQALDVAAEGLLAGIFGACLGRRRRRVRVVRFVRVGAWGSLRGLEQVAQAVPASQRVAVGLAISLGDGAQAVGSVAQRRFRLGVQLVEARVARF